MGLGIYYRIATLISIILAFSFAIDGQVTPALLCAVLGYLAHISRVLHDLRMQVTLLRISDLFDRQETEEMPDA